MDLPWEQIFEIIAKLIENCDDPQNAMKHRFRTWIVVTRALEIQGVSRRDFPETRRAVMERIECSSDEEITAFLTGGVQAVLAL